MSAHPPEHRPAAASRRQMIAARQERSALWRIIHWAGSLQLALVLLATIAAACAIATFTESGFNTQIAQAYIYKAPWFLIWLGVLCVNLFAVTLTRWPWEKTHIGFVVTHYGIITLLLGSMIGLHTGFEGNVTLHLDAPPVSRVTTSRSIIQLESPADSSLYTMPFNAQTARLGNARSREFPIPGTQLKVIADEFSPNILREEHLVSSDSPTAAPGVSLSFSSHMMGQNATFPLTLEKGASVEKDFFGLARIKFSPTLPQVTEPPRETQVVFARFAPVISGAITSGISVALSPDGETVSLMAADGIGASYSRQKILKKPVTEAGSTIIVEEYWPDFAMENGTPVTKSAEPRNPAVLVHISPSDTAGRKPTLEIAPLANGHIAYRISRNGQPYAAGEAQAGETISLGWADWQAHVDQILPQAETTAETVPGPPLPKGVQGIPGFRARLSAPNRADGPAQWIESGRVVSLTNGDNVVRFGYGLETVPLPFSIRLSKFEVPRDEGTDTPADFRATVEFQDARTGKTKTGVARMNHPASFPGTLWANLTGINYKFSQAEWNPRNLEETTLQVLYDPGWLLKWIGSLGICIGIAIMFYWKPTKS